MFTGLVEDLGVIKEIQTNKEGKILRVSSSLAHELEIDDSVSINGACQTVIKKDDSSFTVQAIHVTLEKTTLGHIKSNDQVNLELALRASDRLGGHMVQGHVNDFSKINSIEKIGKNWNVWVAIPKGQERYIVKEGSIAVDGISLTVADLKEREFCVSIIPHTYEKTNLHLKKPNDLVNIEVDILGKYIERLISPHLSQGITLESLKEKGY